MLQSPARKRLRYANSLMLLISAHMSFVSIDSEVRFLRIKLRDNVYRQSRYDVSEKTVNAAHLERL